MGETIDDTPPKNNADTSNNGEQLYRNFFEGAPDAIFIHDLDGRFLEVNEEACRRFGYDREQFLKMNRIDIEAPDHASKITSHISDLQFRGDGRLETVHINRDNRMIPSELTSRMIKFCGFPAVLSISRDISGRKSMEREFDAVNRKLNARVKALDCLYAISNVIDGRGLSLEEKLHRIVEMIPSAWTDPEAACARIRVGDAVYITENFRETEWRLDAPILVPPRRAGTVEVYYLEWKGTADAGPFHEEEQQLITAIAERLGKIFVIEELSISGEQERERFIAAINHTIESILLLDVDGRIQYVNPAFERLTGFSRSEAVGRSLDMLESEEAAEHFSDQLWQRVSMGEIWASRATLKSRDGTPHIVEMTVSPVLDGNGRIINHVAVGRDVTHEIKMEERMRQAQKMEALGTLSSGIAHDFNNILAGIIGYAELVMAHVSPEEKIHQNLTKLLNAGKRGKVLADQILAFSRQCETQEQPVQIDLYVGQTLKLIQAAFPSTLTLRQQIRSRAAVKTDPSQMHRVLSDVMTTGIQTIFDSGRAACVMLDDVNIDPSEGHRITDLPPGDYARLTLFDAPDNQKPFDISQLARRPRANTIDLTAARQFFQKMGGTVRLCREISEGTCIQIWMPHVVGKTVIEEASLPAGTTETGGRILFVDDEPYIADMIKQMVESLGYDVRTTTDPRKALELFKASPDEFDLVITDQVMPEIPGDVLATHMRQIRPEIPIIICSGFSEEIVREKARAIGVKQFLMKPVLKKEMAQAIRDGLQGRHQVGEAPPPA